MTGAAEIALVAFVAQLAVLPGEKVQFIIAALSTRYRPLLVVTAAGTAFAGWTALEILFGGILQSTLPEVLMDAITAGLFLFFGLMLYRSAPEGGSVDAAGSSTNEPTLEADGGLLDSRVEDLDVSLFGYEIPARFGGFLPIFVMMATGEFGDKTQLVTIGLAAQYGAHPGIWFGEMAAILPVSLVNAYFFHRFSHRFDVRKAHYAGAVLFGFFGLDMLLSMATGFSVWERLVETATTLVMASLVSGLTTG